MGDRSGRNRCCNPFKKTHARHGKSSTDLRPFPANLLSKFEDVPARAYLCTACRKEATKYEPPQRIASHISSGSESVIVPSQPLTSPDEVLSQSLAVETLNATLVQLGNSPLQAKKLKQNIGYVKEKLQAAKNAITRKFEDVSGATIHDPVDDDASLFRQLIDRLKREFDKSANDRQEQIRILTLAPKQWGIRKIMAVFGATRRMVEVATKLRENAGMFALPNKKLGRRLDPATEHLAQRFYEENSRELAGRKDYVSVKMPDGRRVHVQKKLVLFNLKELHAAFIEANPAAKIGFTKFTELRPKHCVLAGASGTHTVCVCTMHQNTRLKLEGCDIETLTKQWQTPLNARKMNDLLRTLVCKEPDISCFERSCGVCVSLVRKLIDNLNTELTANMIDMVTFKRWVTVDRCTIETISVPSDDFTTTLYQDLDKLLKHDFIARQQSYHLNNVKENLTLGTFAVIVDFAENYAFDVQEAAQAFHWSNNQATIFPMIVYYRLTESDELKHVSLVGISDCLKHDTVAVYMFQKQLITFLKEKFESVNHVEYFSDGAPQQFKNKKNFLNTCHHSTDFGVTAEWNFFATAHGKGPSDGLAGTVKRQAYLACLKMGTRGEILTPQQLYEWAKSNLKNIHFVYCTTADYEDTEISLRDRFAKAITVKGTLGIHRITPTSASSFLGREFSQSTTAVQKVVART